MDKKNCKYSRTCKSTRKGTWVDCQLGKGLICNPQAGYCKYTPYKQKIDRVLRDKIFLAVGTFWGCIMSLIIYYLIGL